MKTVFVPIMCFVMLACDGSPDVEDETRTSSLVSRAKMAVVEKVPDPSSTEFRNVNALGGYVCGELNTKNRMGAYDGFQFFAFREFSNGMTAWEVLGFNNFGNRIWGADGCLFPEIKSCSKKMAASSCMQLIKDGYVRRGYPEGELMPSRVSFETGAPRLDQEPPEPRIHTEAKDQTIVGSTAIKQGGNGYLIDEGKRAETGQISQDEAVSQADPSLVEQKPRGNEPDPCANLTADAYDSPEYLALVGCNPD